MRAIGIDPSMTAGGVVVLGEDGRTGELAAWYRRRRAGGYLLTVIVSGRTAGETAGSIYDVAHALRLCMGAYLIERHIAAVEGVFERDRQVAQLSQLSYSAGVLAGALCLYADRVLRPLASEWRPAILGIPGSTSREVAKAAALKLVPAMISGLGSLAGVEHVCEAAAIARYAWAMRGRPWQELG